MSIEEKLLEKNEKELLEEIEDALYRSLTQEKSSDSYWKKFCEEFDDKGIAKVKNELEKMDGLFLKYELIKEKSKKFGEVFDQLKNKIGETEIMVYGFYHNDDDTPLYIGRTVKSYERLKQHFQMYTSAFRKFPMFFLEEIKIWKSDNLTNDNLNLFESFLICKLKPYFNGQRKKLDLKGNKDLFEELLEKPELIPVLDHKDLFKRLS